MGFRIGGGGFRMVNVSFDFLRPEGFEWLLAIRFPPGGGKKGGPTSHVTPAQPAQSQPLSF